MYIDTIPCLKIRPGLPCRFDEDMCKGIGVESCGAPDFQFEGKLSVTLDTTRRSAGEHALEITVRRSHEFAIASRYCAQQALHKLGAKTRGARAPSSRLAKVVCMRAFIIGTLERRAALNINWFYLTQCRGSYGCLIVRVRKVMPVRKGRAPACVQVSVARSESFATSGEADFVGADADLIVSPIITFYILKATRIAWVRSTCSVLSEAKDTFHPTLDNQVSAEA